VIRGGTNLSEATTSEPAAAGERAVERPMWPLFAVLALGVVGLDQLTKALVVSRLAPGESTSIVGDWLRIVYGQNSGALFGMFRDNAALFGIVSLGVIALIVGYHATAGRNVLVSVALGLLLGGALGNLTDRLRLGFVVDFVDAGIGGWRWYTFNVADAAISGAIVILLALAVAPGLAERVAVRFGSGPAPGLAETVPGDLDSPSTEDPDVRAGGTGPEPWT
jgi:signal peptidase II